MRRFSPVSLLAFAFLIFILAGAASAADPEDGKLLFELNCSSCHKDGGNFIYPSATLKKKALERKDLFSLEAIKSQVINGRGRMPAFKGRLNDKQIEAVSSYVMEMAEKGW